MATLPAAVTSGDILIKTYYQAEPFTYGVGDTAINHLRDVWFYWTPEIWAAMCPDWRVLPIVDELPTDTTRTWIRNLEGAWTIGPDAVRVTYSGTPKSDEQLEAELTAAIAKDVQAWMDAAVRPRRYDNILAACSYATSTNPVYAAEGQACVAHRDDVWAICFALLEEVKLGKRPVMTSAEVIAELPPLVWPDEVAAPTP